MQSVTRKRRVPERSTVNGRSWTEKAADYVFSRQNADGGYTFWQGADSNAQDTYYGVMALEALKERCGFPAKTVDFLLRCQNTNGGFARSDVGVSAFEYTFQAVSTMRRLAST